MHACLVAQSCLTLCDPMDCSPHQAPVHGDSPAKNTGVGCHALFQGIFPTQWLNPGLPHCRQILHCLKHQGSPRILEWVAIPSPGDLPDPGIELGSPALPADSLPAELPGKPLSTFYLYLLVIIRYGTRSIIQKLLFLRQILGSNNLPCQGSYLRHLEQIEQL